MAREFFPYPISNALLVTLEFTGVMPTVSGGIHDISHLKGSVGTFQVQASATPDANVLSSVLDPSELAAPPVAVVLRLLGVASRRRQAIPMTLSGQSYQAEIQIDPTEWFGDVRVEAIVVRSAPLANTASSFAADRGSIVVLASEPQIIRFEEPPAPESGSGLKTRWDDFTASESLWYDHKDQLFVLNTSVQPPELVLNAGLAPQVRPVLDSMGTWGLRARVRDVSLSAIAGTAIAALLVETLYRIAREQPIGIDNLAPWQKSLIHLAAPIFYPGKPAAECLPMLLKELEDGDATTDIARQKVPLAAQRISRMPAAVRAAAMEAVNNG